MSHKNKGVDTPFTASYKGTPNPKKSSGPKLGESLGNYPQTVGGIAYVQLVDMPGKTSGKVDTPFDNSFKRKLRSGNTLG